MATMTLSYDGRSSVMKHLIEAMLAAGAKVLENTPTNKQTVTPSMRSKISKAREESARGETVVCRSMEEMEQYFAKL